MEVGKSSAEAQSRGGDSRMVCDKMWTILDWAAKPNGRVPCCIPFLTLNQRLCVSARELSVLQTQNELARWSNKPDAIWLENGL